MTSTDGLRPLVERLDREMARFAAKDGVDATNLIASWGRLVQFLALGPAPELAGCPYCGAVGMRTATRCGNCWTKLVPPPVARPI